MVRRSCLLSLLILATPLLCSCSEQQTAISLIRIRAPQRADQRETELYRQTQMALITSPFVLNAALRDPQISDLAIIKQQQNPIAWLQNQLQVTSPGDSEIVKIELVSANQNESLLLIDTVVAQFLDEVHGAERKEMTERLQRLRNQQRELTKATKQQLEFVHALKEELGTMDEQLASIAAELEKERIRLIQRKILALQDELMQAEIEEAEDAIQATNNEPSTDLETGDEQSLEELAASSPSKVRIIKERLTALQKELDESFRKWKRMGKFSADLEIKQMELRVLEKTAEGVDAEISELEMCLKEPSHVQLIQPAIVTR